MGFQKFNYYNIFILGFFLEWNGKKLSKETIKAMIIMIFFFS